MKHEEKVFFSGETCSKAIKGVQERTYLYTKYRYWIVDTAIEDLSTSAHTAAQRLIVIPDTPTNPVSTFH